MASLIEKLNARDKDERYMAMHDLSADLDRDTIKLENELERRVVSIILKHLEDTSTDVKQQAVRTIASLARKVQEPQLEEIADKLATHIINKTDEEKRDIGSIGLKTLVGVVNQQTAPAVLKRVTPKLQIGIQSDTEVAHYCLEILNDLLKNFGMLMQRELPALQTSILPMLASPIAATRKRVSICVASLAICAPDQLFANLVSAIFVSMGEAKSPDEIRTFIQTIAGISRSVGHRLGRELKRIIPLLIELCESPKHQEDVEMLENCLQAFESFVLRCPKEIGPHLDKIVSIALKFIKYDPNYADDEDEGDEMEEDQQEEDEFSDDGDYSGDDDNSWKVRSAAVKCLAAVIRTRPEMLKELYQAVLPQLITRFREREEIVKMEIFSALKDLLRQTQGRTANPDAMDEDHPSGSDFHHLPNTVVSMLDVDKLVKAITKQMKDKSFKTKERCLELLRELILVLNGGLNNYLVSLVPDIAKAIEKSAKTSLKVEALTFLCLLLEKHPGADFSKHVKDLGPSVLASVTDSNYKISAVALRVCGRFTTAKHGGKRLLQGEDQFIQNMYACAFGRLNSQDQDLEVKEAAILTMGEIIATLGDIVGPSNLNGCLPVLLERLRNETTRVTSLKAIATLAKSELQIDISIICKDVVLECSTFLRKNDRALKQAALMTLNSLIASYGKLIGDSLYETVMKELTILVSDAELHLTHLALQLCSCMVSKAPNENVNLIHSYILPRVLVLLQSPLLQGIARNSLRSLFANLVQAGSGSKYKELLGQLLGIVDGGNQLSRQSLSSIAQCVSSLCGAVDDKERFTTLQGFINTLSNPSGPEQMKQLLLHCVGEIGREFDLSQFSLENVIMNSFTSSSEDTKAAASHALGSIAMGAISKYLPYILTQIESQAEYRYLLLQSLRQLITLKASEGGIGKGHDSLTGHMSTVMNLLMDQCDSDDEGVRSMVAECLGKLALIAPTEVLPNLKELITRESVETRATAVHSLKFTITDHAPVQELAACITDFLLLLKDDHIMVRRAVLTTLNSATHNKPALIRPLLKTDWLLPALYGESVYKQDLVRTVNLGPFQHKVDDGAELRKLALAAMDTLLDKCAEQLDTSAFLHHLQDRLSDELDDIKQAAYQMLCKLAVREPFFVREVLDTLADPLKNVLNKKTKDNASPQDVERHNELQRSAMITVATLNKMHDSNTCHKFVSMYESILQDAKLKALLESVSNDTEGSTSAAMEF